MQLILPLNKKDEKSFRCSAIEIGFDKFVLSKFLYTLQESDLDVYPLLHDERISLLIYGWETCDNYLQKFQNAPTTTSVYNTVNQNVHTVIKWLGCFSLDLWLSKEWDSCEFQMRQGLLYCMRRAQSILVQIPELLIFCWPQILTWDLSPWNHPYVKKFLNINGEHSQTSEEIEQSIEEIEYIASTEDIYYLRDENVYIILLRLIKMIDSFNLEGAKQFAMRVLAAWNVVFERGKDIANKSSAKITKQFRECIVCICHVYLLIVYEMDSNRGFVIDNMMNNIRFYYQSLMDKHFKRPFATLAIQMNFTPARFIALTCINLKISINNFFEIFTSRRAEKKFSTLSAVISQSYISYILGNQLMEINNMNEEHFNAQMGRYKKIFNAYLEEREISEVFLTEQLNNLKTKCNSHSLGPTVISLTNIKSKFCKGNRSYNTGNCEMGIEEEHARNTESEQGSDRKTDAIFENMPNNEELLLYVYRILAASSYKGWYFAKIVLLLKIIVHEVNAIETWRYHSGLTTDFMLAIEKKLSKHYEDLALLFHEDFFLEQEFWLTAFYLNPIRKYYSPLLRCGLRWQRRFQHPDEESDKSIKPVRLEKNKKCVKYGLLSSTIDVNEILKIRNHDVANADYDILNKSLVALKLSSKTIKDLLTAIFLPRNKSLSWALNWSELRKRCKRLLKYPEMKKRLVELNMAEANDRLKFLNINYEKYKNRPQLDYGTIEQGYENLMIFTEPQKYDDTDDDDFDDTELGLDDSDEALREKQSVDTTILKSPDFPSVEDNGSSGARRTRARTAAAIATAILCADRTRKTETPAHEEDQEPEKSHLLTPSTPTKISDEEFNCAATVNVTKRNLEEILQERTVYRNETEGFLSFPDIWDFDSDIIKTVDTKCAVLKENEALYQRVLLLKNPKTAHSAGTSVNISDATTLSTQEVGIYEEININNSSSQRSEGEEVRVKGTESTPKSMLPDYQNSFKVNDESKVNANHITLTNASADIEKKLQNDGKENCDAFRNDAAKTKTVEPFSKIYERHKEDKIEAHKQLPIAKVLSANGITNYQKAFIESLEGKPCIDLFVAKKPYSNNKAIPDIGTVNDRNSLKKSNELAKHSQQKATSKSRLDELTSGNTKNNCETRFTHAVGSDSKRTEGYCSTNTLNLLSGESVELLSSIEDVDVIKSKDPPEKQTIDMTSSNYLPATSTNNITTVVVDKTKIEKQKFKLKEVVVRLKRLKVTDCMKLRQPQVRVKRVGSSTSSLNKGRQCINSRRKYVRSEVSSKSKLMSKSALKLRAYRRKMHRQNYLKNLGDPNNTRFLNAFDRRMLKTNMMRQQHTPVGHAIGLPGALVVSPRSASAQQMRMSTAPTTFASESDSASMDLFPTSNLPSSRLDDNIELIQISSSSSYDFITSDDEINPMTYVTPILGSEISLEDPLYEEEIILFD